MSKAPPSPEKTIGRLKRRSDFLAVQAAVQAGSGAKWVAPTMVIQLGALTSSDPQTPGRFGLTVTKKTASSAVVRNRIRRRLRAVAIAMLPDYALSGRDLVLIGRLPAAEVPYDQLQKDLRWCLKRLGMTE